MPFAVTQWPKEPDPRLPDFSIDGWDVGKLPPFVWILSTIGATGVFAPLNLGITAYNRIAGPGFGQWKPNPGPPLSVQYNLQIQGFQTVQPLPIPHTIRIDLIVSAPPVIFAYIGILRLTYPDAISVIGPITMVFQNPAPGTIPNPVFLTPAKWNVPPI